MRRREPIHLLEFLIPVYCRLDSARRAADSVVSEIQTLGADDVSVWIHDDATPGASDAEFDALFKELSALPFVTCSRNRRNLGMSKNIHHMMTSSSAQYSTVLTDDDYLFDDSLEAIRSTLRFAATIGCASVFTPRYSYLESGALHCIACKPCGDDASLIAASPFNAVEHVCHGFILTGHFFAKTLSKKLWEKHMENAYFPMLHFGESLLKAHALFVNKAWFHHTVLNQTFWHAWGDSERRQNIRVSTDFLKAQRLVYGESKQQPGMSCRKRFGLMLLYLRLQYTSIDDLVSRFNGRNALRMARDAGLEVTLAAAMMSLCLLLSGIEKTLAALRRLLPAAGPGART